MYAYSMCYLFFDESLRGVHVMLDRQVHELVLQLGLHHARPLRPNHLYRFLYVDLTVET